MAKQRTARTKALNKHEVQTLKDGKPRAYTELLSNGEKHIIGIKVYVDAEGNEGIRHYSVPEVIFDVMKKSQKKEPLKEAASEAKSFTIKDLVKEYKTGKISYTAYLKKKAELTN